MKLLLPLKYYDAAGRIKPATALYLCIAYLLRSVLLVIAVFTVRDYSDELLDWFYPDKSYLYMSSIVVLPALMTLLILGFREKIWKSNNDWIFLLVQPLLFISVLTDFFLHLRLSYLQQWQFSWSVAITLLIDVLCLYFLVKDKHLKHMIKDWRLPTSPTLG